MADNETTPVEAMKADLIELHGEGQALEIQAMAEFLIERGWSQSKTEYPYESGPHLILGPELFTGAEGTPEHGKLMWKGALYVEAKPVDRQPPLKAYKNGEGVEVLKDGDWIGGNITSIQRGSGYLDVHTERGPVTVGSSHKVRKI